MFQKTACLAIILVVILGCHDMGIAMGLKDNELYGLKRKVPLVHGEAHKDEVTLVCFVTGQSNQVSQNEKYEELERELKELIEEMKRLEKEVEEKVLKEMLPLIKREIEKLRKRLREWHRENDEPEPIKVEATEV